MEGRERELLVFLLLRPSRFRFRRRRVLLDLDLCLPSSTTNFSSPDEIVAAAELQARAFYTSYPLGPLDALMFYQFRVREILEGGTETRTKNENLD